MMEPVPPTWLSVACLPVAVLVFLLPGWLLSRLWQSPARWLTSFLASACLFFNGTLGLDLLGLPLHARTVGAWLILVSVVIAWILYRSGPPQAPAPKSAAEKWSWESSLWFAPAILGFVSIGWHAVVAPLSGYDNGFRWDYLARLTVMKESLHGYPPVSAKDFEYYAWCDGIPPLVSLLNFWIYTATGSIAPALIAARVVGEALLIGLAIHRYGNLLWGTKGAGAALATAGSSALLLWGIVIGQETGLTALSLVAMLYFLELYEREGNVPCLRWAALAAGVGALSREYGLAFPVLGAAILVVRRQAWMTVTQFASIAGLIAGPWYLRNAILTGNPVYPLTSGGLFPGNPVHDATMQTIRNQWGWSANLGLFAEEMPVYFTAAAGVPLLFGVLGAFRARKGLLPAIAGLALVLLLWLWSIPYTAGGWTYSARVLLPAVAILAVLSGVIATWSRPFRLVALGVILLVAADASRRAWFLPMFVRIPPTKTTVEAWNSIHASLQQITQHPVWDALVFEAGSAGILVDHPANHSLITLRGGRAVPLFSPAVAPLFKPGIHLSEGLDRLRQADIGLIAISANSHLRVSAFEAHPFWVEFFAQFKETAAVDHLLIFDLRRLEVRQP